MKEKDVNDEPTKFTLWQRLQNWRWDHQPTPKTNLDAWKKVIAELPEGISSEQYYRNRAYYDAQIAATKRSG